MDELAELIEESEDWLIGRILRYAKERDYTRYTSTLEDAWRISISGLSASLVDGCRRFAEVPEFGPDDDFESDPLTTFGVIEARLHRQRGITLAMFLGLMKYYRQSYTDLLVEKGSADLARDRLFVERCFDRIEIAFCQEWTRTGESDRIDELQDANRRITNEKNAYLTVFESLSDPVILLGDQDEIVNLNHAAAQLIDPEHAPGEAYYRAHTGAVDEQQGLLSKSVLELLPWLAPVIETCRGDPNHSRSLEREAVVDGKPRYYEVTCSTMLDVSDKFSAAILALRDITDRKQAQEILGKAHAELERKVKERTGELEREIDERKQLERALREAEEHLRIDVALQRLRNKVLEMKRQDDWDTVVAAFRQELGQLVSFNACSVNLVDVEQDRLVAHAVGPRRGVHQNVSEEVDPALMKVLDTGEPLYRNTRNHPLFSDMLPAEVCSVVDVPFGGGTVAINSTHEDGFTPTDIHILENFAQVMSEAHRRLTDLQALEESEERFRQAQKLEAIGQLAGGVAHDFNNLLTVINGHSELLLRRLAPDSTERSSIEQIHQANQRGTSLVSQLLSFSRKQVIEPQITDLNEVITSTTKMLERLLGEDVELSVQLEEQLGRVFVDAGQVHQVLMNLAVNARDAMPDGGKLLIETANIELTPEHHAKVAIEPGPYVMVSVSDTGIGMDEETQARIFEPFYTTKEVGKGTGLGLATIYGIVKQSHGYIWVYSEPGMGTTFRIYLPRTDQPAPEAAAPTLDEGKTEGTETVLVVEDDSALRDLVCLALSERGYTVLAAGEGQQATALAEQENGPISLLLTDLIMPGMNGKELAAKLLPKHNDLKVLYTSGYSAGIIDRHGVLEPGTHFLQKPFGLDTLVQKVRQVLDL